MDKHNKINKFLKSLLIVFVVFVAFELTFLFLAKPLIKKTVINWVFKKSDSVYSVNFDEIRINLLNGNILLTNFNLKPDTSFYFTKNKNVTKNLYELSLDTFQIKQIRVLKLFKKQKNLSIKLLSLKNPDLKVYAKTENTKNEEKAQTNVTYQAVRNDFFETIFKYVNNFEVAQIIITQGNLDFLKPRTNNENAFSIDKVTLFLNNFYANKNTFASENKNFFSEDIEVIVNGYQLKLNDNIHRLIAEKVYVNTKKKIIELSDIKLIPVSKNFHQLSSKQANVLDIRIKKIFFTNADFKQIYEKKQLHLSKAEISDFDINIYKQKKSEKKEFNKDTLLTKVDFYPMFHNFLQFIQIDTVSVKGGAFSQYPNILSEKKQISVSNFDFQVFDFFIDRNSANDTTRVLYAKNMEMKLFGFKSVMKDSVHLLTAEYVEASTKTGVLAANDIKIVPNEKLFSWAVFNRKNFNKINVSSVNISGFDLFKFTNKSEININKLEFGKTFFELINYTDTVKKSNTKPFDELFKNFADKIEIDIINIPNGHLEYFSSKNDKNTSITGNFKLFFNDFVFNPYKEKITKVASVGNANILFTNFKINTADSLYEFSIDTLKYNTNKSVFKLVNFKLKPKEFKISQTLYDLNKSSLIKISIPVILISNTNLSNALQSDSLSLSKIVLDKPSFEMIEYPEIAEKDIKKKLTNEIKKKSIAQIVRKSSEIEILVYSNTQNIDSATLNLFAQKKFAIDTLTKLSVKIITGYKINKNEYSKHDTSIYNISKIVEITTNSFNKIAQDNINSKQIDSITYLTLAEIQNIRNLNLAPKFDKTEIFNIIGQYIPKISSDSLFINNGLLYFKSKSGNNEKIVFKSNFDIVLYKFDFDSDSLNNENKLLFADAFKLSINNSLINLKDSLHQILISKIDFNTNDSSINIYNVKLKPKYFDSSKTNIVVEIPHIKSSGVLYDNLYNESNLKINEILFDSTFVNIIIKANKEKKEKNGFKTLIFFLPDIINEIYVDKIILKNGVIIGEEIYEDTITEFLNTKFELKLSNFLIDSVSYFSKNIFFIPVESICIDLNDFKYRTKNENQNISANEIKLDTKSNFLKIKKLNINSNLKDTLNLSKKQKNAFNIYTEELFFTRLNFENLRFNNEFSLGKIQIIKPNVTLYSYSNKPKAKFDIEAIDLYKTTKKFFKKLLVNEISIENVDLSLTSITDTSSKKQKIKDISIDVQNFYVDSTTSITSPNFLYCDNAILTAKNQELITKNKIYKAKFGLIRISTKINTLEVRNFYFKPTIPISSVQDSFYYKTPVMEVYGKVLTLSEIDFLELLNKNLIIRTIIGDSIKLNTYVDKNYPHNPSIKKPIITRLLDAPLGIDISSVFLTNVDVYYEEINPVNQQKAYINIKDCDLKIFRISNDTALNREKDLYTIVKANGKINDSADLDLSIYFDLKSHGKNAKIKGQIGSCNANIFNTYTINAVNLDLSEGTFSRIAFDFKILDTLAIGKMKMEYQGLKAYLISKDTLKRTKLKFVSWLANTLLVKSNNSKYGIYPKLGKIAYIHDRKYSDISFWVKAFLSGVQSTLAFDPKDAKKIRKIMRKNKDKIKEDD